MNSIDATLRLTNTKGQLSILRKQGNIPAIIYGGKEENQKILLSKKQIKFLIEKENLRVLKLIEKSLLNSSMTRKALD